MTFGDAEKAIIKDIAYEVSYHVTDKLKADVKDAVGMALEEAKREAGSVKSAATHELEMHAATCPMKEEFAAIRNQASGGWKTIATIAAFLAGVGSLVITWFKNC